MANVGTLYSQLSPISFSEFTPSRVTRESGNPFLQEHRPFTSTNSSSAGNKVPPNPPRKLSLLSPPTPAADLPEKKYIELQFTKQRSSSTPVPYDSTNSTNSEETVEDLYSTIRRYRQQGPFKPETVIGFTMDSLDDDDSEMPSQSKVIRQSSTAVPDKVGERLIDRPISFALAMEQNPINLFDVDLPRPSLPHNGESTAARSIIESPPSSTSPSKDRAHHNIPSESPPSSTGTPPPYKERAYQNIPSTAESPPSSTPPPGKDRAYQNIPSESSWLSSTPPPERAYQNILSGNIAPAVGGSHQATREPLMHSSNSSCYRTELDQSAYDTSRVIPYYYNIITDTHPMSYPTSANHILQQRTSSVSPNASGTVTQLMSSSPKPTRKIFNSMENLIAKPTVAVDHTSITSPIGQNRPLLRATSSSSTPDLYCVRHETMSYCQDNPAAPILTPPTSTNDESYGQFPVVYLGRMDIDHYTNCIDKCAKKMLDPKTPTPQTPDDVIIDVMSTKIRFLKPKSGTLLKSILVNDLFMFSQCSKNKRLIGMVVWKRNTIVPLCHLLRCSDQPSSNALLESLTSVKQDADDLLMKELCSKEASSPVNSDTRLLSASLSDSSVSTEGGILHKWSAIHVATVRLSNKTMTTISSITRRAISDYSPSQSAHVSVWVSLAQIRLVQMVNRKQVIYGQHSIGTMEAIGTDHHDQRLIGYIIREKDKPVIAYVLWCYNVVDASAIMSFLRQACQNEYETRSGSDTSLISPTLLQDQNFPEQDQVGSSKKGLLSLFRSMKPSIRSNNLESSTASIGSPTTSPSNTTSSSSSSFQSYVSSQQIASSLVTDLPQKRKNSIIKPPPMLSSFDSSEEDFAKYSVTYVGSANLEGPFTSQSLISALEKFKEGGVAVGMASVPRNTVSMHVSSLGINLSDKKQKMFINRNYPMKQIIGYSIHPTDPQYFGFATLRPGFRDHIKVHVFSVSAGTGSIAAADSTNNTKQITNAMKYWLNIPDESLNYHSLS